MSLRIRFSLILLLLTTLACQTVTQAWEPGPTGTPPATETLTPAPTHTFTPSPTLPPSATPSLTPSQTPTHTPTLTLTPTIRPTASPLQLQVFEQLWTAIRDDYLYPDFNGLDWEAIGDDYRQRVQEGLTFVDFYDAMYEMVLLLGDEHSVFLDPVVAKQEDQDYAGELNFVGIGIMSAIVPERSRITIILVFPGSPAEEAGLQMHDSILEADGQPILDETGYRRDLLVGIEGTQVTLKVQTPGEEPRMVTLRRRRITGGTPVPYSVLTSPDGKRVGYIMLPTFNDSTVDNRVSMALRDMSIEGNLDGIILDNRQNSGGSSTVFGGILSYFTQGVVGHFVSREGKRAMSVPGENLHGSQTVPLVVLIGPNTVSFGEIFAGVLKDLNRAYLIGEPTEGNVEILWVYEFADSSRAWIARETFAPPYSPNEDWEETGILPDLIMPSNWDEVVLETDPAVQAALEHFDGQ